MVFPTNEQSVLGLPLAFANAHPQTQCKTGAWPPGSAPSHTARWHDDQACILRNICVRRIVNLQEDLVDDEKPEHAGEQSENERMLDALKESSADAVLKNYFDNDKTVTLKKSMEYAGVCAAVLAPLIQLGWLTVLVITVTN